MYLINYDYDPDTDYEPTLKRKVYSYSTIYQEAEFRLKYSLHRYKDEISSFTLT